jgi:hypothetical protein
MAEKPVRKRSLWAALLWRFLEEFVGRLGDLLALGLAGAAGWWLSRFL